MTALTQFKMKALSLKINKIVFGNLKMHSSLCAITIFKLK